MHSTEIFKNIARTKILHFLLFISQLKQFEKLMYAFEE